MRVLHISPTGFGDSGVLGGGERYAYELARRMSRRVETVFLSFSGRAGSSMDGDLRVEYVPRNFVTQRLGGNPLSPRLVPWLGWADVIHCHQVRTLTTDIPLFLGRLIRRPVFVTDLGGGQKFALSYHLPLLSWATSFLFISEYSQMIWSRRGRGGLPRQQQVIYGGVDSDRFRPGRTPKTNSVLFVGRILPHKGVDYLIRATTADMRLDVVGRVHDEDYYSYLVRLSQGKPVKFWSRVSDQQLIRMYQDASVTVLPSVYNTCHGDHTEVPELLGLTVLESMACGTSVVATRVGSLPEVVEDGVTGYLVPPNDTAALRSRIEFLLANPGVAERMGRAGRQRVLEHFTWDRAVDQCLAAYCNAGVGRGPRP